MGKLIKLIEKYLKKYPNAENPIDHLQSYGVDVLIDIINKSNGKQIIFDQQDGFDFVKYFYV